MAKKWIQKAIKKPGALRKELCVKKGKKIPASKLNAAAKKKGKVGQRARLAKTLSKLRKKKLLKRDCTPTSKPSAKESKRVQVKRCVSLIPKGHRLTRLLNNLLRQGRRGNHSGNS